MARKINRRDFIKVTAAAGIGLFLLPDARAFRWFDDIEEKAILKILSKLPDNFASLPMNEAVIEAGRLMTGIEYVAGTLDQSIDEKLVVKITGLDCVTFVENAIVIARIAKQGAPTIEAYKSELENLRYRNGRIDGYGSRLHYFTDWIYDNEQKGIVRDFSREVGGQPYVKEINFMSTHPDAYKQVKADPRNLIDIQSAENEMNARDRYYIPKEIVDQYYNNLQHGDIIATTTGIAGLDVTHTGFIVKENGKTKFLHANIKKKMVMTTDEELKEYLMGNQKQTGIIVARLVN